MFQEAAYTFVDANTFRSEVRLLMLWNENLISTHTLHDIKVLLAMQMKKTT
tara:strand:- start:2071 stop:2223 length:153 start_codon:yes stop_codon:yes gene_type:complete